MSTDGNDRTLLIGSQLPSLGKVDLCQSATTLHAWSQSLQATIVIANTCKRWGCRFCGEMKAKKLANIAATAKPSKLITLTVNPAYHTDPRTAFDQTRRQLAPLSNKIRKIYGEFEYMRVLEVTKKGWPHYHLVARVDYIPQRWLSDEWSRLTGAPIVDVRKIKQSREVYWYVMKYLAKQTYITWTERRVTCSKHFALHRPETERPPLDLVGMKRELFHPATYFLTQYPNSEWTQIGMLVYKLEKVNTNEPDGEPREP